MREAGMVVGAPARLLNCGHVGCCDSSRGRHATKHFQATAHPVVGPLEPGENWAWCYVDQAMLDLNG